ncbi:hypothetical protein WMY93_005251 [Mugilogobius chulae]|uniref:Uncharacterized protein n=1 Tax=Mugilogobius chulae TaxID=88201 RepID=A0AAW0Q5Q2_9GOBI
MRHSAAEQRGGEGGGKGEMWSDDAPTATGRRGHQRAGHILPTKDTTTTTMPAYCTRLSCQLFLLLSVCRHINTNLLVSENTSVITESPVETPRPPSLAPPSLAPQAGQRSVVLTGENHTENVEVVNPVTLGLECAWTGNSKNCQT